MGRVDETLMAGCAGASSQPSPSYEMRGISAAYGGMLPSGDERPTFLTIGLTLSLEGGIRRGYCRLVGS